MQARLKKLLVGGIGAAVVAAAVGGAAFAQSAPPAAAPKPAQQRAEELLNAFAGKLGKTPEEVRAAIVAVQKERVAADLAAGRITQQQADRLNQRIDQAGGLGVFHGGPAAKAKPGPGGPKAPAGPRVQVGGDLAAFLGVQPRELREALAAGKSLAQFAQEKGKSRDQLKAHLTETARAQLARAVAAGRLTQAQADARLAELTSRLDQLIDRAAPAKPGNRGPNGRTSRA